MREHADTAIIRKGGQVGQVTSHHMPQHAQHGALMADHSDLGIFRLFFQIVHEFGNPQLHLGEVLAAIERLRSKKGMTVILITHHMDECIDADRLVVMSGGKIVADGKPKEVFTQVETMCAEGLAVPETTELIYGLRAAGWEIPLDALSVEECADAIAEFFKKDK